MCLDGHEGVFNPAGRVGDRAMTEIATHHDSMPRNLGMAAYYLDRQS